MHARRQRLLGQYRLIVTVGRDSQEVDWYVVHRLSAPNPATGRVLAKGRLAVSEQEIEDDDWRQVLERAAAKAAWG